MKTLLLLHAAATCYMCGVIWFVQLVHYPLFSTVGRSEFVSYQLQHVRRTGWVVGPAMLLEASAAGSVCFPYSRSITGSALERPGAARGAVWLSTFAWQVPCHNALLKEFDPERHAWLVRSNWLRTILWTMRALSTYCRYGTSCVWPCSSAIPTTPV